jgi:hypothetical protein
MDTATNLDGQAKPWNKGSLLGLLIAAAVSSPGMFGVTGIVAAMGGILYAIRQRRHGAKGNAWLTEKLPP